MTNSHETANRAADHLARRLHEAGCRHAFGMPGGEVLTVMDALARAGIRVTLARHENAAAFMAEGVWHRTGAPGILIATLGPGVLNGVNAIANAHQDRVPLIVISGCVDADEALTYSHQILDHEAVLAPITKATFRLTAQGADIIADKAVGIATEGRPGPVHIDVPISIADMRVTPPRLRRRPNAAPMVPAAPQEARDWLAAAERPVMIVGLDAVNEGAGATITEVAERLNIPVITTYKAKGIIPETHPLALGGAGLSPLADGLLVPLVQKADLILCVGYDPIEMRPGWREIWDPAEVRVIDIAAEPNHQYMHQATMNIVGACAPSLAAIAEAVTPRATWPGGEVAEVQAALALAFPRDDDWGAAAVIAEARRVLPEDTIATVDSGAHRILLSQMWTSHIPRALLQSTALCTMGCAVPLAMGAKLATPDATVVSFSGDAGFLMVAGELSTVAELKLPVIFVVFVDASLALIEKKQRERQMVNLAVDFGLHDFAAIGRAFGGHGVRVTNRAELRAALEAAQKADTFTVIAAEIDRGSYDNRI
ncbi:acetolactate synthase-1/2/3 large subunit [Roseovarius azorensis]|uniref:Acetolactate synthase-1/2/3 large subunit n=1 Tax=Roseovarius azorensis TaxID=1287727 RepID=A0A1H7K5U3_9RHOB|nr:thiamine pyrophosphate-binding protein [Roseovarius azorensis]SEK81876.1 acetolactate synthase-1/2/3 large subunit [Roseovarius azorensis]